MSPDRGAPPQLLGPAAIRSLAAQLGVAPVKRLGQHFVVDSNTVLRIVRLAAVGPGDVVLEVGPGLGSLTLPLLQTGAQVVAIEIDATLAEALPETVRRFAPSRVDALSVLHADALDPPGLPGPAPTALVANLPYNVSVPVLLTMLERHPSLASGLVMVQWEVAARLTAAPGTRDYGVPTLKAAWYAAVSAAGSVSRSVFWPVPRVDSGLVALRRRPPPNTPASRVEVFSCIDAAFAQRRKTLRAALAGWAGGAQAADAVLRAAGVDPGLRGERLELADFAAIAAARSRVGGSGR